MKLRFWAWWSLLPMLRDEYYQQFLKLLPRGPLWRDLPMFKSLFMPLAAGFEYIESRLQNLIKESRALTAVETLEDKEAEWGLPDPCTGQLATIYERQIALWQKMTDTGGQRRIDYIQIAARLGYTITIEELKPTTTKSRVSARISSNDEWSIIKVNILSAQNETYFKQRATTKSRVSARISQSSHFNIECVFNRIKPAHLTFIFNYQI